MTLIAAVQGKRCALLASDLQVRFADEEQLALPFEQRNYKTFIHEKFNRLPNGDYLAFWGRLNSDEYSVLSSKSLNELLSVPLIEESSIRNDLELAVFYVSISNAQIYIGQSLKPLGPMQIGMVSVASSDPQHAANLREMINRFNERTYEEDFLERLSPEFENYLLNAEKDKTDFGGFVSYLVSPRRIRTLAKNPGKLQGCQEAYSDSEGLLYY